MVISLWWTMWILFSIFGGLVARQAILAETVASLADLTLSLLAADLGAMVAAILAFFMVRQIRRLQSRLVTA